ncbi:hypothetical protein BGZ83_006797 [Gryganskiella cystojenkinii]|nr:hypothetical protein BGZ83_006797 [Gryganskiella cystojenkinii]
MLSENPPSEQLPNNVLPDSHQSPIESSHMLDKRVPPEIWENIFNRLLPSQLSRLSMVNKRFNTIVGSLIVWSQFFTATHGTKKRLRHLRGIPENKSFMLFMCASSLHICEKCFGNTAFDSGKLSNLPLPVLTPLPSLSTAEVEYLGERLNEDWYYRICLACRKSYYLTRGVEPIPKSITMQQLSWSEVAQKYPAYDLGPEPTRNRNSFDFDYVPTTYSELTVLTQLRLAHGGAVGVAASWKSSEEYDDNHGEGSAGTACRIREKKTKKNGFGSIHVLAFLVIECSITSTLCTEYVTLLPAYDRFEIDVSTEKTMSQN